jgi:2C-methyl-D-erythritol 2,4-cyclodiphosphate synthase
VAQLNNGGLSNVSNPVAAGALNQALGPAVFTALTDALQAADNWADINTNALPTDTSAPAASGDETILGAGDVVSVQNHQVTNIPLSQAPEPLQEALGNGVMNGLQSGTGH